MCEEGKYMPPSPRHHFEKNRGKVDPLEDRDAIRIAEPNHMFADIQAVNVNHILDSGEFLPVELSGLGQVANIFTLGSFSREKDGLMRTIDWNSDDKFTQTMSHIEQDTIRQIFESDELSQLIEKDEWTRQDRASWESGVSQIISNKLDIIPGFNKYRIDYYENSGIKETTHFNDLSKDLTYKMSTMEFDCDVMSVVEGAIIQRVENSLLPEKSDVLQEQNYKYASNYFITPGNSWAGETVVPHTIITSSATGNIIEATFSNRYRSARNELSSYVESSDPENGFEDTIEGKPFIYRNGGGEWSMFTTDLSLTHEDFTQEVQKHIESVNNPASVDTPNIPEPHQLDNSEQISDIEKGIPTGTPPSNNPTLNL